MLKNLFLRTLGTKKPILRAVTIVILYALISFQVNFLANTKIKTASGSKSNIYLYAPQLPMRIPKLMPARNGATVPPRLNALIKKYNVRTVKRIPIDSLS